MLRRRFIRSSIARRSIVNNQKGQGLIEYLIIVALMGVATIAIMRVLGEVVKNRFSHAAAALQGDTSKLKRVEFSASDTSKSDLGDFFKNAALKGGSSGAQAQ